MVVRGPRHQAHLSLERLYFILEAGHFLRLHVLAHVVLDLLGVLAEEKRQLGLLRVVVRWRDIHEHQRL